MIDYCIFILNYYFSIIENNFISLLFVKNFEK